MLGHCGAKGVMQSARSQILDLNRPSRFRGVPPRRLGSSKTHAAPAFTASPSHPASAGVVRGIPTCAANAHPRCAGLRIRATTCARPKIRMHIARGVPCLCRLGRPKRPSHSLLCCVRPRPGPALCVNDDVCPTPGLAGNLRLSGSTEGRKDSRNNACSCLSVRRTTSTSSSSWRRAMGFATSA